MFETPAIRPDLNREFVTADRVLLFSEVESHSFDESLFCSVIGRIDGRRKTREIVSHLSALFPPQEIYYALATLEKSGMTVESSSAAIENAAWWYAAGVPAQQARERLASCPVQVSACDGIDPRPFEAALCRIGVRVEPDASLQVALVADPVDPDCERFHRRSLESGQPWLLVKPAGRVGWIGPLFRPGVTGCWECLRRRLEENHFRAAPPACSAPNLILDAAANQLALWIAGASSDIEGALLTLDTLDLTRTRHLLARRPHCPACGQPQPPLPAAELVLESRPKLFVTDGGHRVLPPSGTRAELERHVSPLTGVVRGVRLWEKDGSLPIFTATFNGPLGSSANRSSRGGSFTTSAGKGVTADQAWTSCVAEALERYSAFYSGDEPMVRGAWRDMRDRAVHPNHLTLFSPRQYRLREQWNEGKAAADQVPFPFDESADIEWCAAWSLATKSVRYLPAAYVLMEYRFHEGKRYCWGDSNGCAGGNTIEEAILQGFLELVERDAVAIWWFNRLRRPAVDLDRFGSPAFSVLRDHLKSEGRSLHLLDVTTDLDTPCYVAASWREDGTSLGLGFGAHLDPRIAASRALTELNQCLPSDAAEPEALRHVTAKKYPWISGAGQLPALPASLAHDDIRDDILHCARLVERHGMDLVVLNLTRPEIGFPVVRVAVPGLRHFRPRFAPGRLYEVPVRMGWLARPLTEARLNQVPLRT